MIQADYVVTPTGPDRDLCDACCEALAAFTKEASKKHRDSDIFHLTHQSTLSTCRESAEEGCKLCSVIWSQLSGHRGSNMDPHGTYESRTVHDGNTNHLPIMLSSNTIRLFDDDLALPRYGSDTLRIGLGRMSDGGGDIWCRVVVTAGQMTALPGRKVSSLPDLKVAASWLQKCATSHPNCLGLVDTELPTRLIHVSEKGGQLQVAVHFTEGQTGRYLALSHCWGARPSPVLTTSKTIDRHLNGIDFSALPETFRDALSVTRALDYAYLWIDSLCIMQDSKSDWIRECAKMHSIYSNADLTIAASAARDSHAGFPKIRLRNCWEHTAIDNEAIPFTLTVGGDVACAELQSWQQHGPIIPTQTFPPVLGSRAWALQERLLSPRVLHVSDYQMSYECESCEYSEAIHNPKPPKRTSGLAGDLPKSVLSTVLRGDQDHRSGKDSKKRGVRYWYAIVEAYSRCRISKSDDTLPALSGIAQKMRLVIDSSYLAGHWEKDLVLWLAWFRSGDNERCRDRATASVPSWSWISCNHDVSFVFSGIIRNKGHFCPAARVLQATTIPSEKDGFGQVTSGKLTIEGFSRCQGSFSELHSLYRFTPDTIYRFMQEIVEPERRTNAVTDMRTQKTGDALTSPQDSQLAIIVLGGCCCRLRGGLWVALVLYRVSEQPELYKRIGFVEAQDRSLEDRDSTRGRVGGDQPLSLLGHQLHRRIVTIM